MKKTESYEAMLVFSLAQGEEGIKALVEKFKGLIESAGTLESVEEWGKRKLAYPINYEPDGYYVLYTFSSAPEFPAEFDRVLGITDGVLRSLITVPVAKKQ
ncbi:MAG: 30S ribosomal protein S6 [Oscillospiraceae bacterium]|nr:30S ribosomal protein S6 [Oscillospiraceae bacterium]